MARIKFTKADVNKAFEEALKKSNPITDKFKALFSKK